VLIAVLHSPSAGVVMLVVFVGFQLIENHFLYPVVMSRSVRMNPLWVLLSVLIGANLGGVFGSTLGALAGAVVAIPVGGAVQLICGELWNQTKASSEVSKADQGPDPVGDGPSDGSPTGLDGGTTEGDMATPVPAPKLQL
jgi:predicted PurR-regulated permease PerM